MPQWVMITSKDIVKNVEVVLRKATKREVGKNIFMTAYQILAALPRSVRKRLIRDYGQGGKGSGNIPAATKVVSEAAEEVANVEIVYMDTRRMWFVIPTTTGKNRVKPSRNTYCGLFRLPDGSPTARRCNLRHLTAAPNLQRPSQRRASG